MTTYPFAPRKTPAAPLVFATPAYSESPPARALAREITAGTTTRVEAITVVWMGQHLALVRRQGEKFFVSRGDQGYAPVAYEAFDMHVHRAGTNLPRVVSLANLAAPCVAPLSEADREKAHVGQGYYGGFSVPASIVGRAGSAFTAQRIADWVAVLQKIESRYMDLAESACRAKEAREAKEAAAEREARAAHARVQKLHHAAPKLGAALRAGILSLALGLAERPAAQAAGLTVADVLRGKAPEGAAGAWTTLRVMLAAVAAAGLPPVVEDDETAAPHVALKAVCGSKGLPEVAS